MSTRKAFRTTASALSLEHSSQQEQRTWRTSTYVHIPLTLGNRPCSTCCPSFPRSSSHASIPTFSRQSKQLWSLAAVTGCCRLLFDYTDAKFRLCWLSCRHNSNPSFSPPFLQSPVRSHPGYWYTEGVVLAAFFGA